MEAKEGTRIEIELRPVPESSGVARAFVRRHLVALGLPELVEDGCLIAAELVTNAIKAAPRDRCRLALIPNGGRPVIEVWDVSPRPPVLRNDGLSATSGRGLVITAVLSADWGHRLLAPNEGTGKVVWARLR